MNCVLVTVPFKFFNEGITDIIGEQVYDEYLRRTGSANEVTDEKNNTTYVEAYVGSRALVTAFIEMIAQASDIPSDKVREGVISGYMNGIDLDDSELAPALNQIFYPEFIKQLRDAQLSEIDVPLPEVLARVKQAGL